MNISRSEKGQTATEFMVIAGLLLGAIFLILGITLGWYTHAVGSALAVEGAAREGVDPGSGFALVDQSRVPGDLQAGYSGSLSIAGRTGKIFSVTGQYDFPLKPLGFNLDTHLSSSVIVPVWEFIP
jgi:hypothetical protein